MELKFDGGDGGLPIRARYCIEYDVWEEKQSKEEVSARGKEACLKGCSTGT